VVDQWARAAGRDRLQLTVNKDNYDSIAAYEHLGFSNAGPIWTDIGGGFAMADFVMDKPVVAVAV
jgi:RimJ/RimL family protein N-acetyltransferase